MFLQYHTTAATDVIIIGHLILYPPPLSILTSIHPFNHNHCELNGEFSRYCPSLSKRL